jgi:endogenous inhibitor of DNA gyrase (YacG/DUF329 family)
MRTVLKEKGPQEVTCPRCGEDAEWSFLDSEKTRVQVVCPECGRFEVPRETFDLVETEISEPMGD